MTIPKNVPDKDLIKLANKGDQKAMESLYFKYRDWVFNLAWRFCGNKEEASDILQDVFIYFFNQFPDFQIKSQLKTYLYPIIKNTALNLVRKKRRVVPLDESLAQNIPDSAFQPDLEWKKLYEWVEELPKEEQELLFLRFYDEFSLEEIGDILKIPLGTVKSRLHRTLSRLRKKMKFRKK